MLFSAGKGRRLVTSFALFATAMIGLNLTPQAAEAAAVTPTNNTCATDGYCYADFTTVVSAGTWSIPANTYRVDILAVGGGGGGTRGRCSYSWGTGGGGGGVAEATGQLVTPGATATISVGAGGTGSGNCTTFLATNGGGSSVAVGTVSVTGNGGIASTQSGASTNTAITSANGPASGSTVINGVTVAGNAGGTVNFDTSGNCTLYDCNAGGGGGAGAAGSAKNAGTGKVSALTGVRYGGGGAGRNSSVYGTADSTSGNSANCAATANFGGGGADCGSSAAAGGSGYVYIRYLPGPTVTAPSAASISTGSTATFTTAATKSTNLTSASFAYQWQQSTDNGSTWTDLSGATSASYTTTTQSTTANSGYQYRAKVTQTGTTGSVSPTGFTYTSAATLTVQSPQNITFGAITGKTYGDAAFTVSATSSSGLTVAVTSATTGVCTVSGTTVTIVTAGTCTLNANQAGDGTYYAATQVQQSFTVAQKALTITANNDTKTFGGTKTYGAGSTAFTSTGLVSGQTIGTVTITASGGTSANDNVGNYSLTPSSAIGGTFAAANYSITYSAGTLAVSAANPTFTWSNASTTYSTGGTYSLTAPTVTAGGSGTWVYTSNDTTVASVQSGALLNLNKAGSATITGTFTPTSSNYNTGTTTMVLTVNAGSNSITWSQTLANVAYGSSDISLTATASSGLAVTYSTNNSAVCAVSGSTLTIVGVGSCTVTAAQGGNSGYLAASSTNKTFTVTQASNAITFGALAGKTYGDAAFTVAATSSSGLAVAFTSATTGVCNISSTTITIVAAGTCTINANQAGNVSYVAATQVTQSFSVSTKTLTVTASNDTKTFGATKTYGAGSTAFTSTGLVGSETIGSVTITPSGGAAANGNVGTYSLTPSLAVGGTFVAANYAIAYVAGVLTVGATNPTFTWADTSTPFVSGGTYTLSAPTVTAGGTGTWVYSSSDSTVASISSGAVLNILKTGTTVISATFTSTSSNFNDGSTSMVLTVSSAGNSISWSQNFGSPVYGSATISLNATASSGLTVAYSTNDTSICSVSGSTLTIVAARTCVVTANQSGNSNYSAAAAVAQTISIGQAANSITFTTAPTGLVFGETGQTRQVSASLNSGTISYSTSSAACSVDSVTGVVTILTAGSCVITATASGVSANYVSPSPQSQTLNIALASVSAGTWSNATTTYSPGATYALAAPTITSSAAQGSVAGTWSYLSSDSTVVTVSGSTLSILKPGTVTITGTFTPTNSSLAGTTATFSLAINLGTNVISFGTLSGRKVTAGNFTVSATASSGLTVVVTSGTTSVCSISNNTVTVLGIGTCTLNANQAGNSFYDAAIQVSQSFVISAVTVTFDSNYGTPSTRTQSITSPAGVNLSSSTFTRTGYTFTGWSTTPSGSLTHSDGQTVAFTIDTTIYALWSANNYGITYFANGANGGSVPADATVYNIGQSIAIRSNIGALTRTGYTFGGWNTASNGGGFTYNSGDTVAMGAQSVTLFAIWTPNTYAITYNYNGASGSASRSGSAVTSDSYTTAGTAVTLPSVGTLAKTGYTFSGWATSPTGTALVGTFTTTSDQTLYAQWTIMTITVNYSKGAASASSFTAFPSGTTGNFGTRITLSGAVDNTVTISGNAHVFVGWSDGTSIYRAGDQYLLGVNTVTFTAQWVQIFGVRYSFGGGTPAGADSLVDTECLLAGYLCTDQQAITANAAPSRAGYTFAGWVDQSGTAIAAGTPFTVSTGSYLLYATWQAVNYSVIYQLGGASGTAPIQSALHYGDTFTLASAPTRTGYDFAGWSDGSLTYGAGAQYTVGLSNLTLTAVWTPHIYNVAFDWNGGSGASVANRSYTVGTVGFALPSLTNQTKDGYTFGGWALTSGGTQLASPFVPTESTTLFAIWNSGNYTLTFTPNYGFVANSVSSVANGSSILLPNLTRNNFVFDGWYSATTGGSKIGNAGASYTPTASVQLYARWIQASLYGVIGSLSRISTITASNSVDSTYSGSNAGSSVSVTVPRNSLPAGTTVTLNLITDNTYAQSILAGTNNYILSMAVSWLAPDETVPDTAGGNPITLTIANSSIRAGALIYSVQNGVAVLLGTATTNGSLTVTLTSDPSIYIVQTIPSNPVALIATATSNSATFTWSAPNTDGGSQITSYLLTLSNGDSCTTTTLSCTFTNLTAGTTYTGTLEAINAIGSSATVAAAVTPVAPVAQAPVVAPPVVAPPVVEPPVEKPVEPGQPKPPVATKPIIVLVPEVVAVSKVLANNVPVLNGVKVVDPIRFAADSSNLDVVDMRQLAVAATKLKGLKGTLLITGFVKYVGKLTPAIRALALARAKTVAKAMVRLGVSVKIGYLGYGPKNTATPSNSDRKVELRWVPAGK